MVKLDKVLEQRDELKLKKISQKIRKNNGIEIQNNLTNDEEKVFKEIINRAPKKEKLTKFIRETGNKKIAIKNYLHLLVNYVFKILQKKRFTGNKIEKTIFQRPVYEMILDGQTHYVNPCFDYSLLTSVLLEKLGFEKVKFKIDLLSDHSLHFGIDFEENGQKYFIDYHSYNQVNIGSGEFKSNYKDKQVNVLLSEAIDGKEINEKTTIYDIKNKIQNKKLKEVFTQENLNSKIEKLKKDNDKEDGKDRKEYVEKTQEKYSDYLKIFGKEAVKKDRKYSNKAVIHRQNN